jgi:hypothetical protein
MAEFMVTEIETIASSVTLRAQARKHLPHVQPRALPLPAARMRLCRIVPILPCDRVHIRLPLNY